MRPACQGQPGLGSGPAKQWVATGADKDTGGQHVPSSSCSYEDVRDAFAGQRHSGTSGRRGIPLCHHESQSLQAQGHRHLWSMSSPFHARGREHHKGYARDQSHPQQGPASHVTKKSERRARKGAHGAAPLGWRAEAATWACSPQFLWSSAPKCSWPGTNFQVAKSVLLLSHITGMGGSMGTGYTGSPAPRANLRQLWGLLCPRPEEASNLHLQLGLRKGQTT